MKNSFNFWNNLWTRSTSAPVKIHVKKLFCELQSPPLVQTVSLHPCEHKTVWHCLEQDVWRLYEGMWTWTCNSIRWYQIRTLSVVQWASVRVTISFSIWIKNRSSIQKNVHQNFWMCIHPMCILSDSCWSCSVKVMKNHDSWFMINLIWNSVGKPLSAGYVCCN